MADAIIEGDIDLIGTRVGVFGGTFDPVHNGHCALVSQFKKQCRLDSVIVILAATPPHKLFQPLSDFRHRFAMLSLAFSGSHSVFLSRLEQFRDGPSYTIDTLKQLKNEFDGNRDWFFAIGQDTLAEIHTWKQYREIPELACLAVFNRTTAPNFSADDVVRDYFPEYITAKDIRSYFRNHREVVRFLDMPAVDISSSQIRKAVANNGRWHDSVPEQVCSYIKEHSLYK